METATLEKNEQTHVERMGSSFAEPTMSERFNEWASRTISVAKREEKKAEGKSRPREVNLEERSDEEKKFIQAVGEKPDEAEKKPSAKDAAEKDATKPAEQKPDAKPSEKPAAKAAEKSAASESPNEPLSGDLAERHWQGKLQRQEIATHIEQVNRRAGIILDFVAKHPQKAEIAQGFNALMAGRPEGPDQPGFFRDLATVLAEVASPGEVFRHITLQPQDREAIRGCKTPKELRAAIHTIAKHYAASAPKAPDPKPRAPKPPSEVAGRSALADDTFAGMSFSDFSGRQSQRYKEA